MSRSDKEQNWQNDRIKMLQPGDKAPNVVLKTLDGSDIALAEMWNGRQVLLVFLRHLG